MDKPSRKPSRRRVPNGKGYWITPCSLLSGVYLLELQREKNKSDRPGNIFHIRKACSIKNNNVKMYGCNIFRKMHGCSNPKFPKEKQEQKKQSARNTRPTETAALAEEMPLSSTTPPYYIGHKRKNRKLHRMRARSQSPTGICCYYSFASRTNPER